MYRAYGRLFEVGQDGLRLHGEGRGTVGQSFSSSPPSSPHGRVSHEAAMDRLRRRRRSKLLAQSFEGAGGSKGGGDPGTAPPLRCQVVKRNAGTGASTRKPDWPRLEEWLGSWGVSSYQTVAAAVGVGRVRLGRN